MSSRELDGWMAAARTKTVWYVLLGRAVWIALCVLAGASDMPLSVVLPAAVVGTLVATLIALRVSEGQRFSLLELADDQSLA
jgi:hypothetical protein